LFQLYIYIELEDKFELYFFIETLQYFPTNLFPITNSSACKWQFSPHSSRINLICSEIKFQWSNSSLSSIILFAVSWYRDLFLYMIRNLSQYIFYHFVTFRELLFAVANILDNANNYDNCDNKRQLGMLTLTSLTSKTFLTRTGEIISTFFANTII
jgi:hypothetical protein